jgi:FKBP-type peptidyl-prolyl cis-trans isomerase FklB
MFGLKRINKSNFQTVKNRQTIQSINIILMLLSLLFIVSCKKKNAGNQRELRNDIDSISYYTGIFAASTVKDLDFPKLNTAVFYDAVKKAIRQKDLKISKADASYNIGWYFDKLRQKQDANNLTEGREFLASNKTQKGVITTKSGLQYEVIMQGKGNKIKENDHVVLHQKGLLIDGREFVNTFKTGKPDTMLCSKENILPGWYETLHLMNTGSKYKIYLPAELGFGINTQLAEIKPNMVVIFEIELL